MPYGKEWLGDTIAYENRTLWVEKKGKSDKEIQYYTQNLTSERWHKQIMCQENKEEVDSLDLRIA